MDINQIKQNLVKHIRIKAGLVKGPWIVTAQMQREQLNYLKASVISKDFLFPSAECFFVVDLRDFSLSNAFGVEIFGYDSKKMSFSDYLESIFFTSAPNLLTQITSVLDLCLEGSFKELGFMVGCYETFHPLRAKDGNVWYVKRQSFPFQLNEKKQVVSYLNYITKIKKFNNEKVAEDLKFLPQDYAFRARNHAKQFDQKVIKWNPTEEVVILFHLNNGIHLSEEFVSKNIPININTLKSSKRQIRFKTEKIFDLKTNKFSEALELIKREGLI